MIQDFMCLAEDRLMETERNLKYRKKVFYIAVEILQNIFHHSMRSTHSGIQEGYFFIEKKRSAYVLKAGNLMANDKVEVFRDRIDEVNRLNKTELKKKYINILDKGTFSEKGGVGLGIMEIVRKSGNRLAYHFERLDDFQTYFNLEIKVSN